MKPSEGTLNVEPAASTHTAMTDVAVRARESKPTDTTDTTKPSGLAGLGLADYSSDED